MAFHNEEIIFLIRIHRMRSQFFSLAFPRNDKTRAGEVKKKRKKERKSEKPWMEGKFFLHKV
jgi:hypothetical protein